MRVLRTAIGCLALCAAVVARAEVLPRADAYVDAPRVALVVEARVIEGDRVEIASTLASAAPLGAGVRELRVAGLSGLSRKVDVLDPADGAGRVLDAKEAVLLLDFDDASSSWKPLNTFASPEGAGSCGVYWVKDSKVWSYGQTRDPGPLTLRPWRPDGKTQGTVELLRRDVAAGLAAQRAWNSDTTDPDLTERAWKLVRWLRPATSPDGARVTQRRFQVRDELSALGSAAVAPLVALLAAEDDADALEQALGAIADLGPSAKDAVPRLIALSQKPMKVPPHALAFALRGVADERTIPALRALFDDAPLSADLVLDYTAETLVKLKDPAAAERLVKKLPPSLEGFASVTGILVVLRRLHGVDHRRAQLWLRSRASHSLFDPYRDEVNRILTTRSDGTVFDRDKR